MIGEIAWMALFLVVVLVGLAAVYRHAKRERRPWEASRSPGATTARHA